MNSNRQSLSEEVSQAVGLPLLDVKTVLQALLSAISRLAIDEGRMVEIRRFGTFRPSYRRRRPARNPRTGEAVEEVPNRILLRWIPSPHLKRAINVGKPILSRGTRRSRTMELPMHDNPDPAGV